MRTAELLKDPYPACERLRRESPVCRLEPEGYWLVTRHAEALAMLKDPQLFRSARPREPIPSDPDFLLRARSLVGADPPEHPRLRALVKDAFTPSRLRALEGPIRSLVRARLGTFAGQGSLELVGDFSKQFPMEVLTLLMGVPLESARDFVRWCDILVTWGAPDCRFSREEVQENAAEMRDFFSRAIRARAGDGLIAFLSRAEPRLSPDELLVFLRLLLVAGTETTTHLIGNTVLALLDQEGLWNSLQADPGLVPDLIEESLRFDGPVPCLIRWATADTSIGGVPIRKGEAVMPVLVSANHDEAVFPQAARFDLHRPVRQHLSFGGGAHYCMGTLLARLQVRVFFEELLAACSKIERASEEPIEKVESFFVRGPVRLALRLTAR